MKGLQLKSETYLEPKRASMIKLLSQKSCIRDIQLGSEETYENNEIFKTKLRWSKSS